VLHRCQQHSQEAFMLRGIALWMLGIPIPIIILLWLFL
jgi:hypothetical protein